MLFQSFVKLFTFYILSKFDQSLIKLWQNFDICFFQINPAYNPISKVLCFFTPVWRLSQKIPFLQYHHDTTGTPPRHHRNTTKTWARHPKHHRTPSKHHSHTTKVPPTKTPTTTETQLRDHQDTSTTDTTNYPCKGCFPKVAANTRCHNHFFPAPSSRITIITTPSQHHHHTASVLILILIIIINIVSLFHQPCLYHHHTQQW